MVFTAVCVCVHGCVLHLCLLVRCHQRLTASRWKETEGGRRFAISSVHPGPRPRTTSPRRQSSPPPPPQRRPKKRDGWMRACGASQTRRDAGEAAHFSSASILQKHLWIQSRLVPIHLSTRLEKHFFLSFFTAQEVNLPSQAKTS